MSMSNGLGRKYLYSRYGQLHIATSTSAVTGQTSFAATTPTFLIYQASAANRVTLDYLKLRQGGTAAGGDITVRIYIDSTNRFSSGGTAITPVCPNMASGETASWSFRHGATAAAASADERLVYQRTLEVADGQQLEVIPEDEIQIGATGSIFIATYAATTGPTWTDWAVHCHQEPL